IHDAKQPCSGGNPDCQGDDRGQRKAWAAPETASGVSNVSRDIFCKGHRASLQQLLLDLSDAAKLTPRRVEGLARLHPTSNEALPSQLFTASLRDRVELRLAVALRGAPLRRNPALLHQAQ